MRRADRAAARPAGRATPPAPAPSAPVRAPRARRGPVVAALRRELEALPDVVQTSTEAAVALQLARQVDQGLSMTSASRELTRVMAVLRRLGADAKAAEPRKRTDEPPPAGMDRGPGVSDLAARAAARRAAAAG
jgi:hypothetical protein